MGLAHARPNYLNDNVVSPSHCSCVNSIVTCRDTLLLNYYPWTQEPEDQEPKDQGAKD